MELEELKRVWPQPPASGDGLSPEEIESLLRGRIKKTRRSLAKNFFLELLLAALIYGWFAFMVLVFGKAIRPFMWKLVALSAVSVAPIVARLWRSLRWMRRADYSRDIRSHLLGALHHYRISLRIYLAGGYLFGLILIAVLLRDSSFLSLPAAVRILTLAYIVVIALLARPYLRLMYGRHLESLEREFLR